jgi:hypothetical protein
LKAERWDLPKIVSRQVEYRMMKYTCLPMFPA